MRKVSSKKRSTRAASSASSSNRSLDDKSETEKKVSNGAGKKDGANDLEDKTNQKNVGEKNLKSSSSQEKKGSKERSDDKNNRKRSSKDESDQSSGSDSSDDEALSKIAKVSTKTDTSSKGKENKKQKLKQPTPVEEDAEEYEDEDAEYEVEEVVSHKKTHGKMLYLIKWKGYGSDDNTWEKAATLDNCPDILKKYTDANPDSIPESTSKTSKSNKKDKKSKDKKLKKLEEIAAEEFDENADYEVERIIDVFFKKDKSREFLVRWKGYRSDHDTWEPEDNLKCPDLIEQFMAKVEQAKNLSEKELRPNRKHTDRFTLRTQTSARRLSRRHDGKQRAVYYDAED